jgi:BolA family transcriptional regulator, general stress-responsive regulator
LSVARQIETALNSALTPERLEVIDESHKHIGHAGSRPEGETHFRVQVVARSFAGKSRLERQRLVLAPLAELMKERIHALSIEARTPEEAAGVASAISRSDR